MIWKITFRTKTQGLHIIPVVADSHDEAIEKAKRMIPFVTKVETHIASIVSNDEMIHMRCHLNDAFEALKENFIGNSCEDNHAWDKGFEHYNETMHEILISENP